MNSSKQKPQPDRIPSIQRFAVVPSNAPCDPETFAVSQSCGNVSVYEIKERTQRTCNSQPFLKPDFSLLKVIEGLKPLYQSLAKKHRSLQVPDGSSLCASKLDPGHASHLHAALQLAKSSALSRVRDEEDEGMERKGLKQEDETVTVQPSHVRSTTGKVLNPEWQSMTESAVKITLDPKTANPSLRISADRRRIRTLTIKESKEKRHAWIQRAPHKYDGWFCIQGTQGFSSGRHYWEVDMRESSDWRIGVVKESAPRHGFTKLTTSSGYWTLCLQLGSLIALTDPVTKLNQPIPKRVGVYLDMEGRQVRFFDAKQRRHIYTFQADFGNSEKIYPVFGTVETDRELVIL